MHIYIPEGWPFYKKDLVTTYLSLKKFSIGACNNLPQADGLKQMSFNFLWLWKPEI